MESVADGGGNIRKRAEGLESDEWSLLLMVEFNSRLVGLRDTSGGRLFSDTPTLCELPSP